MRRMGIGGVIQRSARNNEGVRKNYAEIVMTYVRMMRCIVEKSRGYSMDIPALVARTSCSISLECVC